MSAHDHACLGAYILTCIIPLGGGRGRVAHSRIVHFPGGGGGAVGETGSGGALYWIPRGRQRREVSFELEMALGY